MFHVKQNSYAVGLGSVENTRNWDSGVDAVSQVLEGSLGMENYDQLYKNLKAYADEVGVKAYQTKVGSYSGKRWGDTFLGVGMGRYYVSAVGERAQDVYLSTMGCPGYYTRLDCQITVEFDVPQPDYVERQYRRWVSHGHPGHSPKQARYIESKTGSTMYLGTRQNERFFRLYDKSTWYEKELGSMIRFEVEFHKSGADNTAWTIETANDIKKAIGAIVFAAYHQADIRVPVSLIDPLSPLKLPEKAKGSEHYLEWLKTSVQPVVRHLRHLGLDDKIQDVLGLQKPLDL